MQTAFPIYNSRLAAQIVPLEAATASDPEHYRVTVNGQAVTVESAAYNATTRTVTLSLPDGTLQAGARMRVAWSDLLDAGGQTVSGQTALKLTP